MFSTYFILLTDLYRYNLIFIMIFSGDAVRLFLINDIENRLLYDEIPLTNLNKLFTSSRLCVVFRNLKP